MTILLSETFVQMSESNGDMPPVYNAATVGADSILLVDDTLVLRERLSLAMQQRGFRVETAGDYDEAVEVFSQRPTALAVLDLRMPGKSGLELLRKLLQMEPKTRIILLSGFGSIPTSIDAVRAGAVNFLSKPADADDILSAFVRGDEPSVPEGINIFPAPSLARNEWEHIHRVLSECGGNISEAARRLGIHRRSLQRKLRKRAPEDPTTPADELEEFDEDGDFGDD
ncbi:response regulator transcription factor [Novipirellula artificiosorum]|uniref:Photosynthetic apparatus regulatory protein RegA n=1 Tax=Novipirellula artificiosorum TaxID=2528016 RepID=A0A5C6DAN2_9BACT|nr:response regulator [Novipirellula artificiosorum]TWU34223.1 Photosynthetic apparatus regulatory protein RegA [Novipirellula artificiosorum]